MKERGAMAPVSSFPNWLDTGFPGLLQSLSRALQQRGPCDSDADVRDVVMNMEATATRKGRRRKSGKKKGKFRLVGLMLVVLLVAGGALAVAMSQMPGAVADKTGNYVEDVGNQALKVGELELRLEQAKEAMPAWYCFWCDKPRRLTKLVDHAREELENRLRTGVGAEDSP